MLTGYRPYVSCGTPEHYEQRSVSEQLVTLPWKIPFLNAVQYTSDLASHPYVYPRSSPGHVLCAQRATRILLRTNQSILSNDVTVFIPRCLSTNYLSQLELLLKVFMSRELQLLLLLGTSIYRFLFHFFQPTCINA